MDAMKVNDLHSAIRGVDARDLARTARGNSEKTPAPARESADGDSLELTLSAQLSAGSASESETSSHVESALTDNRLAEIQSRIKSGFYSQPGTLADTADRILSYYSR
jgi:anti-sigma28 factor (negative regulator of flagellin synthesis)